MEHAPPALDFLAHQRYRVTELCAAEDMVFGLTENGVCAAHCIRSGRQLCVLNSDPSEIIRSLFHNRINRTLITVSVYAHDQFSCLRCRETKLARLREGVIENATPLYESESLRWPGFVEFDDVNGKVLTFSADRSTYKVWSMAEPSVVLYEFDDTALPNGVEEIKISPGIMLLIAKYDRQHATHIPLRILAIETGDILRDIRQPLKKGAAVDIIEQFNERLLLKQEGHPLLIIDLLGGSVLKVPHPFFDTPAAFIFLFENHTFLAFKDNTITVWNFKGEMLASFDDHRLYFPIPDVDHTSVIYITQSQETIISLCEDPPPTAAAVPVAAAAAAAATAEGGAADGSLMDDPPAAPAAPGPVVEQGGDESVAAADGGRAVSIHVSNVKTGKLLARIDQRALPHQANVTALCYSEETGDIITGNDRGYISVWSN